MLRGFPFNGTGCPGGATILPQHGNETPRQSDESKLCWDPVMRLSFLIHFLSISCPDVELRL